MYLPCANSGILPPELLFCEVLRKMKFRLAGIASNRIARMAAPATHIHPRLSGICSEICTLRDRPELIRPLLEGVMFGLLCHESNCRSSSEAFWKRCLRSRSRQALTIWLNDFGTL